MQLYANNKESLMSKPECNHGGKQLSNDFPECPECGLKFVSSSSSLGMEALEGVRSAAQGQQEALEGLFKKFSILMESTYFNQQERTEISKAIHDRKHVIFRTANLNPDQINIMDSKLDFLINETETQKKDRWKYILIGIIFDEVAKGIINFETALIMYEGIMNIVIDVLNRING